MLGQEEQLLDKGILEITQRTYQHQSAQCGVIWIRKAVDDSVERIAADHVVVNT